MDRFVSAPSILLLLPWIREQMAQLGRGSVIVATAAQKRTLKDAFLRSQGGLIGWSIQTKQETIYQAGGVGHWEIMTLLKSRVEPLQWPVVDKLARTVELWCSAGYSLDELPVDGALKTLAKEVISDIEALKRPLPWNKELLDQGQLWAGWDPLDLWGIPKEVSVGLIGDVFSNTQLTAIRSLERHLDSQLQTIDEGALPEKKNITVIDRASHIPPAILGNIQANQQAQNILWMGSLALAGSIAVKNLYGQTEEVSGQSQWNNAWSKNLYTKAHIEPQFNARLEYYRNQADNGKDLKINELVEQAKEQLGVSGILSQLPLETFKALPPKAPWNKFLKAYTEATGDTLENLAERLQGIEKLLPVGGVISKELWLELLSQPIPYPLEGYPGVQVLPLEDSFGLVDENSIVAIASDQLPQIYSLLEGKDVECLNKDYYKEDGYPLKGFLTVDPQPKIRQIIDYALKKATNVVLGDVFKGIIGEQPRQSYKNSISQTSDTLCIKHAARINSRASYGVYDYALPVPINATCKEWEEILTTPELQWYKQIGLERLWMAQDEDPQSLWVGDWVHHSLEKGTVVGVREYFQRLYSVAQTPSLVWQQAYLRAYNVALLIAKELESSGAKTESVEKSVKGVLTIDGVKLSLRGRLDRAVRLPNGKLLIIDFKTSPSVKKLSQKNIQEGDGLQLWLYGRLLAERNIGLCRMTAEAPLESQVELTEEFLLAEKNIAKKSQTGFLGQSPDLWGRFGAYERLPRASWPIDREILYKRMEADNG